MTPQTHPLIEVDDSILIVIDVQTLFVDKVAESKQKPLVNKICWLMALADWCDVPLVVTAEEHDVMPLHPEVEKMISAETPIHNKLTFGLADQANIMAAVEQTRRKTAILIGLETDVCVMHSALGLQARGYRVVIVTDAVGSPGPGHAMGLQRMAQADITLVNMKMLFYEWLRTVEVIQRFHRDLPHMRDQAGIVL